MTDSNNSQSPQAQFQSMNMIHMAMLTGQVMIAGILYFVIGGVSSVTEGLVMEGGIDTMVLVGVAVFMAASSASFLLYNKRKQEGAKLTGGLMEKIKHYRSSFILRAALLEGPNLTLLVFYFFVTSNIVLLGLFAIGLGLFGLAKPSADRFAQDYQLSGSEQSELRNSTL